MFLGGLIVRDDWGGREREAGKVGRGLAWGLHEEHCSWANISSIVFDLCFNLVLERLVKKDAHFERI